MIPNAESFKIKKTSRDAYGKVTTDSEDTYYGVIDRQTQFRSSHGDTVIVGEGMVFTSELKAAGLVGQEIIIDDKTWTITQVYDAVALGNYHHTEITYG